jgi:hypothetical protein
MTTKEITRSNFIQESTVHPNAIVNRKSLRLAATLLFAGVLLSFVAGFFHPDRENANNHVAAFTEYASSEHWTAVHLGQFAGMAVIIAGLLVLFLALNVQTGTPGWAGRFGAISAVVTLALYGVLQAVDGVALKQRYTLRALKRSGGWSGRSEATKALCWVSRLSYSRQ